MFYTEDERVILNMFFEIETQGTTYSGGAAHLGFLAQQGYIDVADFKNIIITPEGSLFISRLRRRLKLV